MTSLDFVIDVLSYLRALQKTTRKNCLKIAHHYKMVEQANTEYSKRVVFIAKRFDKLGGWGIPSDLINMIEFLLAMPNVSEKGLPDTCADAIKKPVIHQSTMDMLMLKTQNENDMRKRQTILNKLIKSLSHAIGSASQIPA